MHVNSIDSDNRRDFLFGYFIGILFFVRALTGCTSTSTAEMLPEARMMAKTCSYLWAQQGEDGGWHSATHGILRGGQAYTPYIFWHLMTVPDAIYPKSPAKIQAALNFIRRHCSAQGVIGRSDPDVLEYPNYATSFALRSLAQYGNQQDQVHIDAMKTYLLEQQFDESRAVDVAHKAYGSWGFGEVNLSGGFVGHADLSHTRRVLEALRDAGLTAEDVFQKARKFLALVQNEDGGFYYSPIITGANKAGSIQKGGELQFRSYATATSDGVLASLAAGLPKNSREIQAALSWLRKNPGLHHPGGIPTDSPGQWHKVMVLYHLSVRAEVYQTLGKKGAWKQEMYALLEEMQEQNGSFFNPLGARNKENDPLLGSTLALCILEKIVDE